jgi:cell division protein FtsN
MKFNPYTALLTTGALMLATVIFAQLGSSMTLLKTGAQSVDADVSSFAARTASALRKSPGVRNNTVTADQGRVSAERMPTSDTRVASIERSDDTPRDEEHSVH